MLLQRFLRVTALIVGIFLVAPALQAADEPSTGTAAIAHIKLSGELDETPTAMDPLFGFQPENFRTKLERIQKAKKDKNVKALYLHLDGVGINWGKFNEFRQTINDFKKSGKKVYAYIDEGSTMDYLLAASCDEVVMPESGFLLMAGLRAETTFFLDLFKKIGLEADMMQMGEFKGAGEPFTRSTMSPEFRKQLESVLDDYFDYLTATIADCRKSKDFTPAKVKALLDDGPFTARQALKVGLIDRLTYEDEYRQAIEDALKKELKVDKVAFEKDYAKAKQDELDLSNPFAILKLLSPAKEPKLSKKPKVAVIYATGEIITGKGGASLFGGNLVGSTTMVEAIRKAEEEPTVKAIVLRVDSPGGSALASDLIWHELARSKKPVVASMSDVAASGGYYISMASEKIYAEPGTLTGSIGVIGGKIVFGDLYKKVGVNTEVITRGKNADVMSSTKPFNESERKVMRAMMEDVYDQFLTKALEGRKKAGKQMTRTDLEKLAGGRIWTGRQAKANGLIDELGTLEDAIAYAKDKAGLGKDEDVELLILPKPRSFIDNLLESMADSKLPISKGMMEAAADSLPGLAPHLRSAAAILNLHKEPVWAVLPYRIEVK